MEKPDTKKDFLWLIWSMEHGAWWAPNKNGYTDNVNKAGRYTLHAAIEIIKGANIALGQGRYNAPNEAIILDRKNYQLE